MNTVTLHIHLSSGTTIELPMVSDDEAEEVAQQLAEAISGPNRPHWHLIDTTLIFTGAISAIEVL